MDNKNTKKIRSEAFLSYHDARKNRPNCKYGHPLSGDNLRILGNGARNCLACGDRRNVEKREARHAERVALGLPPRTVGRPKDLDDKPRRRNLAVAPMTEHSEWLRLYGVKKVAQYAPI